MITLKDFAARFLTPEYVRRMKHKLREDRRRARRVATLPFIRVGNGSIFYFRDGEAITGTTTTE